MNWFDGLLYPIKVVVAWIMVNFHTALTWIGLDPEGGLAWGLSIVGLVVVIRILLIPLFFRQIRASRGMQLLAPEMQKIQKKYKGKSDPASREAMSRETMALYKKHGTNPFASCLPILAQSPIFFALFRVLYSLPALANGEYSRSSIGPLTKSVAEQAEQARIFGAPLSGTFMSAGNLPAGDQLSVRLVTILLIVAMSVTTFTTQRQLTMKNMPPASLQGPMAQQQKVLLYVLPLIFAFSGINFPIGVLIYWTTTNLWSMGQQFYTIRRMPAPGSQAELAMKARKAKRAAARGDVIEETETPAIEERRQGQRQQPVRKARTKPRPTAPGTAAVVPGGLGDIEDEDDEAPTPAAGPRPGSAGARPQGGQARKPGSTPKGQVKRPATGASSTARGTGTAGAKARPAGDGGTGGGAQAKPGTAGTAPRKRKPASDTSAPRQKPGVSGSTDAES